MAKVLKYIGKGQWMNVDENEILPTDKIQKIKKAVYAIYLKFRGN